MNPTTNQYKEKSTSLIAVIAVVAIMVGALIGYMAGKSNSNKTSQSNSIAATHEPLTDTKAAGLRVLLNGLEQEHVALAAAATRAGFDGTPSFMPAAKSLDNNSKDLAAAVASVYGKEAGDKFYEIWNSHIGFFVDYTVAAKKGDQAGMAKAVENLNGYVDAISTFFSTANPNLPKQAVATLVGEHVGLLKAAVDKYGAGDIAGSYEQERLARTQIGTVADAISAAIVKQNPDTFKD